MLAPEACVVPDASVIPDGSGVAVVVVSGTDPPRDGQPSDEDVRGVEEQGEDDDAERSGEHLVERVGAAQGGDAAEDLVAEPGAGGERGDGGDAHQHLRGDPDPG